MREKIKSYDMDKWVKNFVDEIERIYKKNIEFKKNQSGHEISKLIRKTEYKKIIILSDFDGTLVGFKNNPEDVQLDSDLLEILEKVSNKENIEFHVLSGRSRDFLESKFGSMKVNLHSDHGLFSKFRDKDWEQNYDLHLPWKEELKVLLEHFSFLTPGSFVEDKIASVVWHYRKADLEISSFQLKELKIHFLQIFSNHPVRMIQGNKAVEFRMHGISKANIAKKVLADKSKDTIVVSMGDDHSDGEIFTLCKDELIFIAVGEMIHESHFRLKDFREVRNFIKEIIL